MRRVEQQQIRMARMLADGRGMEAVMEELGISRGTFYRWRNSAEYKRITSGLVGPPVPVNHPDMVAALEVTARSQLNLAELIAETADLSLRSIVKRLRAGADEERLVDLIAAAKFALEQHDARLKGDSGYEEEETPGTVDELAEFILQNLPREERRRLAESLAG